jgi:hypothetical protein
MRCQTPASCRATSRRQQAMPEPHPISCGSRFHAMPERSTNTIARVADESAARCVKLLQSGRRGTRRELWWKSRSAKSRLVAERTGLLTCLHPC